MAVQTLCLANALIDTTVTRYCPIMGRASGLLTDEEISTFPIPAAGKFKQLRVWASAAPGSGNDYIVTLQKGGADQTLTATISGTAVYAEDVTHEVSCSLGDLVSWSLVPVSSPTDESELMISVIYEAVGNNSLIILGGSHGNPINGGAGTYTITAFGSNASNYDTSADLSEQAKISIAGTITAVATNTRVTTDTSAAATIRVFLNGTAQATADILVTDGTGLFDQSVTGLSIAVAANDLLHSGVVVTGTAINMRHRFGIAFDPTDTTKCPISAQFIAQNSADNWPYLDTQTAASATAERLYPMPECTIGDFGIDLGSAPGSGNSWTYVSRTGATIGAAADGNVSLQVTDAATSDTDTGDDSLTAGHLWGVKVTPASTPTAPTNGHRLYGIVTWPSAGGGGTVPLRTLMGVGV